MSEKPWIIRTLMDTDLYKINMLQGYYHNGLLRQCKAKWRFKARNAAGHDLSGLVSEIRRQIEHLGDLSFSLTDIDYLRSQRYLREDFLEFLRLYRLDPRNIRLIPVKGGFELEAEGPQLYVTLFEIYVLAIVSEVHTWAFYPDWNRETGRKKLYEKIALLRDPSPFGLAEADLAGLKISDFGTRRRLTRDWQEEVLEILKSEIPQYLTGSSNLYFAKELGLKAIGTQGHEWFQSFQQQQGVRLEDAQKAALEAWVAVFRGKLGIALTDCYNMEAFCRDFDLFFAKLFDGLRHDSGCPFAWGKRAIRCYADLGIDPKARTLVFSDSLDFAKMLRLYARFRSEIGCAFGIGTNLTNDVPGAPALSMVMKVVEINDRPVAKISDSPGKSMCDDTTFLQYLAQVYRIENWRGEMAA